MNVVQLQVLARAADGLKAIRALTIMYSSTGRRFLERRTSSVVATRIATLATRFRTGLRFGSFAYKCDSGCFILPI